MPGDGEHIKRKLRAAGSSADGRLKEIEDAAAKRQASKGAAAAHVSTRPEQAERIEAAIRTRAASPLVSRTPEETAEKPLAPTASGQIPRPLAPTDSPFIPEHGIAEKADAAVLAKALATRAAEIRRERSGRSERGADDEGKTRIIGRMADPGIRSKLAAETGNEDNAAFVAAETAAYHAAKSVERRTVGRAAEAAAAKMPSGIRKAIDQAQRLTAVRIHRNLARAAGDEDNAALAAAETAARGAASALARLALAFGRSLVRALAPMAAAAAATVAAAALPIVLVMALALPLILAAGGVGSTRRVSSAGGAELARIAMAQYEEGQSRGDAMLGGDRYWSWYGFGGHVHWCACFVDWCANEAGFIDSGLVPRSAVCNFESYYMSNPSFGSVHVGNAGYNASVGDLMQYGGEHIGIVVEVEEDGSFWTVEGNCSNTLKRKYHQKTGDSYTDTTWGGTPYYMTPAYPGYAGLGEIAVPETCGGTCAVHGEYWNVRTGTYGTREWDLRYNTFAQGSNQRRVQDAWAAAGSVTDSRGFQTIDGMYLIACTSVFGEVGDWITFTMSDGTVLECIKIDAKCETATSYDSHPANTWGHDHGRNILEFCGSSDIGANPYSTLGLTGEHVVSATNHGPAV